MIKKVTIDGGFILKILKDITLTVSDSNNFLDIKQKYNYIVAQSNQIITSETKIVAIEYFLIKIQVLKMVFPCQLRSLIMY
ncbi:MAG: hypothetical protein OMM_10981 [Candidatus Magnetoglobus multicellularis str. Araruama]|uniref:Uncharacterized protein n=1 Tax=Candidatus Magnetoglobus multicellularis str. Araruama TaxID=890399 RepID=A0A1V1NZF6_9BACT|nr:MAG: hypothetical protein OMM_10981 [Candidatus Magnetoglobus multicellularis str. Araruama]